MDCQVCGIVAALDPLFRGRDNVRILGDNWPIAFIPCSTMSRDTVERGTNEIGELMLRCEMA